VTDAGFEVPFRLSVSNGSQTGYGWVAFIEDWRGGSATFIHPACFAETGGIASLLDVVHRRDLIERGSVLRVMIDDLRKRLDERT
jgi:hypothetical protein